MEFETNSERPVSALFEDVKAQEPKPVASFVPANAAEQKELFLRGETDNPQHHYDRLQAIDFDVRDETLARLGAEIDNHSQIPEKHKSTYRDFIECYRSVNRLMQIATLLKGEDIDEEVRAGLEEAYGRLNTELYGGVDHETYSGLVAAKMEKINSADLRDDTAIRLRQELVGMLPGEMAIGENNAFRPGEETIRTMQRVVDELYGELLKHVPDEARSYEPHETAVIFQQIIDQEFGEAADGWQAIVTKAKSINVVASDKLVKIPEDRGSVSGRQLKGLIVHELGVHMLRAVRGSESDLLPMEVGFAGYYDSEEGLGKVMEQAVAGKYTPSGVPYYIIAGFMSDGHDFRQTFERVWRLNVLEAAADGTEITESLVSKKRAAAYSSVLRIARGTDYLPWNKDLAYYNGSTDMWKYFEQYSGDELMLNLALIGKIDSTNSVHMSTVLETRSVE